MTAKNDRIRNLALTPKLGDVILVSSSLFYRGGINPPDGASGDRHAAIVCDTRLADEGEFRVAAFLFGGDTQCFTLLADDMGRKWWRKEPSK